ncbi:MAG: tetratricopeptide repeat protein, partial [Deltaproteobacteria bacterium]|nr:tetratricopeptide repeat protein [Deltaproteobacteria bacterium]
MFRLSDNISSFRKHVFPLFFLMAGIIIIYSNALDAGFQLDDQQIINRPNLHVTELSLESLKKTFYWTPHLKKLYRPIPCLTLGLNYYFGGTSPFGYHVVNIAIHLACSFSVYVFLLTLLSIPGIRPRFAATYRYEIAVIAACLFAFHPIQTNVATYVIQRITSMAALFYMCSMTGYIWFRLQTLPGKERSRLKKYLGLTISIASGILAFLSKENTAFLPVMILLADCLLFYGLHHEREKKILRRMYAVFIFLLLGILAYEGPKYLFKFFGWYGSRDFTLMERMLTQPRIIFFYLYLLFVPDVSLLNLGHDIPVSTSFIDPPQTLIAISGIISLVAAAFFLRKKHNLFAFAIVWYLGNLVIESSIIPLELMFEHRTYLPGVLVFFLISFTIVYVSREVLKRKKAILFAALLLILYGNGTYIRNVIFRSTTSLWLDVVDKSPNLPRGHANLGNTYRLHGHFEKAIEELKKAIHLKPDMVEPLLSLGVIYL